MGNEEADPVAGGRGPSSGPEATGPTWGSAAHDTTGAVTTVPVTPGPATSAAEGHGVLDRVRSMFDGDTPRRALGWVLLVAWAGWLVALWVVQPRMVPAGMLEDELAAGRPTTFAVVRVDENRTGGPFSTNRVDVSPVADEDRAAALDGTYTGPPVSIAYWVDAPVARLRVVDPNGMGSEVPAALVRELTAAGVPESPPGVLRLDPAAERTYTASTLLALAGALVVIVGPRPRRGTRWFWFWLGGGGLLSVGVALFALAELIRPRPEPAGTVHEPGVAGRWRGLTGFAVGVVLSIAGAAVTIMLTDLSPIWFLRS